MVTVRPGACVLRAACMCGLEMASGDAWLHVVTYGLPSGGVSCVASVVVPVGHAWPDVILYSPGGFLSACVVALCLAGPVGQNLPQEEAESALPGSSENSLREPGLEHHRY